MKILAVLLMILLPALAQAAPSPVGDWRTFDDRTGKERSLVRIEEIGGELRGRIVATIDPADADKTCDICTDDRKGHKTIGLEVIRGLRPEGDHWADGRVLNPETGSIYHATLKLEDGGEKLVLRGYVGITLLGRSQTWLRAHP